MSGESDLATLVRTMRPVLAPGRFVFVTVAATPEDVEPVATIREDEGLSLVLSQSDADRLDLSYDVVLTRITLQVHSALDAVGLTAVVAQTLASSDISCNVIAGHHHDHLFVPAERAEQALRLLQQLSGEGTD